MNPTAGVYGKVPAQADFVRGNVGEMSRLGLDRWFQEAHEVVHAEHHRIPAEPISFALAPAGGRLMLGVLTPSQDAVGRVFPLIMFALVDASSVPGGFPNIPTAYARFYQGAALALEGAEGLGAADLTARAQALGETLVPERTADPAAALAGERMAPLGLALGGLPHGAAYALRTLATGCDKAKSSAAGAPTGVITVDAPAPTDGVRLFWLELIRRRLGWSDAQPTFLWTPATSAAPRLLVGLGPPATTLLSFLANPRHKSGRFWPLRTEVDSALDSALAALAPEQRKVLENPAATLAEVIAAFR
jgi:type VI secretion system ImpM family protein